MRVLFVASECAPYAKTGGLADVVQSLPPSLRQSGVDARVLLPRYSDIHIGEGTIQPVASLPVSANPNAPALQVSATLSRLTPSMLSPQASTGIDTYLLDAPHYFTRPRLYGYVDDTYRFGYFSYACLQAINVMEEVEVWTPDIIHCHDWHTGLVPVYLNYHPDFEHLKNRTATVFTIHNLAYQGLADKSSLPALDLPWELFNYHQLEFHDQLNPLKAGIVFSNAITTVSPTYAREIQSREYGFGLEGVLQEHAHQIQGILNGINYQEWNPGTDPYLSAHYDSRSLEGKVTCKQDLLRRVNLPSDDLRVPVIGIVSRLSAQKGFDLIASAIDAILARKCYLVLLGAGDHYYERTFRDLHMKYSDSFSCELGERNEAMAHIIYAGSDFFLMPSQFEPCGLSQMISLAYGTLPIVRSTGGLSDTITEVNTPDQRGNGFVFRDYNTASMLSCIDRALTEYKSDKWRAYLHNALASDYSWDASARHYVALYERTAKSPI